MATSSLKPAAVFTLPPLSSTRAATPSSDPKSEKSKRFIEVLPDPKKTYSRARQGCWLRRIALAVTMVAFAAISIGAMITVGLLAPAYLPLACVVPIVFIPILMIVVRKLYSNQRAAAIEAKTAKEVLDIYNRNKKEQQALGPNELQKKLADDLKRLGAAENDNHAEQIVRDFDKNYEALTILLSNIEYRKRETAQHQYRSDQALLKGQNLPIIQEEFKNYLDSKIAALEGAPANGTIREASLEWIRKEFSSADLRCYFFSTLPQTIKKKVCELADSKEKEATLTGEILQQVAKDLVASPDTPTPKIYLDPPHEEFTKVAAAERKKHRQNFLVERWNACFSRANAAFLIFLTRNPNFSRPPSDLFSISQLDIDDLASRKYFPLETEDNRYFIRYNAPIGSGTVNSSRTHCEPLEACWDWEIETWVKNLQKTYDAIEKEKPSGKK